MGYYKERTGVLRSGGAGLKLFTRDDMDTIHFSTLRILEKTGLIVESREAAEIFHGAGCRVMENHDHFRVWIPQYVVHDCLAGAPHSIVFHGRRRQDDYEAEPGRVGFATFGECINVIDPVTRECRPSTKKDCGEVSRVIDALPEMAITLRTVCSGDQYPESQAVHNFETMLNNSSKHLFLGVINRRNLEKMVEMAHVVCGGEEAYRQKPIFSACLCPTSPLTLVKDCCEAIITCARTGTGMQVIPMCLSGGSSPATVSATVLQHNCEELSALVLAQLTARGTKFTYGSCSTIMDLKTGNSVVGAPEYGMINAGIVQMARYYQLTVWCGGGLSDAKIPDAQVGYEFTINALQAALAGANMVYGSGCLDLGLTFDYAKLLMDHECMGNIRKVLEGIPTDNDSLCVNLIEEVGPGGSFLTQKDTLKRARNQSKAVLFDRHGRERWARENPDGRTVTDRAYDAALAIIANHQPLPLPPGAAETVSEIVKEYDAELKAPKGAA